MKTTDLAQRHCSFLGGEHIGMSVWLTRSIPNHSIPFGTPIPIAKRTRTVREPSNISTCPRRITWSHCGAELHALWQNVYAGMPISSLCPRDKWSPITTATHSPNSPRQGSVPKPENLPLVVHLHTKSKNHLLSPHTQKYENIIPHHPPESFPMKYFLLWNIGDYIHR